MYRPKTLFQGYKIGLQSSELYVGIPDWKFANGVETVSFGGKTKIFRQDAADKISNEFVDTYGGRGTYRLRYYRWEGDYSKKKYSIYNHPDNWTAEQAHAFNLKYPNGYPKDKTDAEIREEFGLDPAMEEYD